VFIGAFFPALIGLEEADGNIYRILRRLIGSFVNGLAEGDGDRDTRRSSAARS
jgi:hypothetical protein